MAEFRLNMVKFLPLGADKPYRYLPPGQKRHVAENSVANLSRNVLAKLSIIIHRMEAE